MKFYKLYESIFQPASKEDLANRKKNRFKMWMKIKIN